MTGHAHGHGHAHESEGPIEGRNKIIALLIAVLALFLAFSETLGKSAQTTAISHNVEAANLWAFFQAKNIRRTTVLTAAEAMKATSGSLDAGSRDLAAKQIEAWQQAAARYRSEPKKGPHGEELGEGTEELMKRARAAEEKRDTAMARYHHYELASAAFQVGIVLASATVITGMLALSYIAGALGVAGLVLMAIGLLAPHAIHLF
jgi:hypothetical protein